MVAPSETSISGCISALGKRDFAEIEDLWIAATCLVALARDLTPAQVLKCLSDSFEEQSWNELKDDILVQYWEDQMRAAAAQPPSEFPPWE